MNRCFHRSCIRILPGADGFSPGLRLGRLLRLFVAALAAFVLSNTSGTLQAADDAVTNTPALQPTNQASVAGVTNQFNVLDDKYRLAIGDQLSFKILEDEDDPKIIPVTDSGDLEVPYVGRYPAVGKTCKELAQELKVELEKKYYWQATVVIAVDSKPKSRGKVYLAGAVGGPGPQDISGDEILTVSKAILRAGGLTGFADGKSVRVTRSTGAGPGDETNFIVNVTMVLEKGKFENDPTLQPGDLIYVPERLIRF
jgi:polysaccharide biosynthesis/export protein